MGGIGLGWTTSTTNPHTHTHIHTYTRYTHNQSYTWTHIYAQRTQETTIYTRYAHNMHTHREQTENNTEHSGYSGHRPDTEQNKTHREQRTTSTENSAHNYRTYSFDFYHLQQYIKKLYNTAIYKLYTFCSPHQ